MEKIVLYGEYYMVGIQKDKEEFLKDVRKTYNEEWGYDGDIKLEDVHEGIVYGNFADNEENSRLKHSRKIHSELLEEFGTYKPCFYVDMEDIEE